MDPTPAYRRQLNAIAAWLVHSKKMSLAAAAELAEAMLDWAGVDPAATASTGE